MDRYNVFLFMASLSAFLGVAMGAFGAHMMRATLGSEMMAVYQTAVNYQMWHALGLSMVAILLRFNPDSMLLAWAGWLLVTGIILFSGSLYALSISGVRWLGAVTPLGGTSFLIAWILIMVFAVQSGMNN